MIIGRGDIAKAITDREGYIFFCRGNSRRTPLSQSIEDTEHRQIYRASKDYSQKNMFVYISTLSIYYSDSEYTKHKLRMEKKVKRWFRNYCILRIGNITWGDNPNTLINYLKKNPNAEIQDTYRYLIDQYELNHWLGMIPRTGKHEMNVTGERMKVQVIANKIKHHEI